MMLVLVWQVSSAMINTDPARCSARWSTQANWGGGCTSKSHCSAGNHHFPGAILHYLCSFDTKLNARPSAYGSKVDGSKVDGSKVDGAIRGPQRGRF